MSDDVRSRLIDVALSTVKGAGIAAVAMLILFWQMHKKDESLESAHKETVGIVREVTRVVELNASATREAAAASQSLTRAVQEQTQRLDTLDRRVDRLEHK